VNELLLGAATAFWLGILTSLSPCPLASNLAAISFVSRRLDSPRLTFLAGLLYTAGRALAYTVLGVLLVTSLLSAPFISSFLQTWLNKLLGPVLIVTGLFLLEWLRLDTGGQEISQAFEARVEAWGLGGALALGVLFALTFCPVSAALFFGSLVPLALKVNSGVLLPAVYGVATGLPVLIFAVLLACGAAWVGKAYQTVTGLEKWGRYATGTVFILVGV
jgi:cytochrome c-type biogenesis protein